MTRVNGQHRLTASVIVLGLMAIAAALAPLTAPHRPAEQFADRAYAPPMVVHVHDDRGWHAPFVYPQVLVDRLMRQYRDDQSRPTRLIWFANGRLVSSPPEAGPLLLLGGDALGRDLFSRLMWGAALSLGVALFGTVGALGIGVIVGGFSGSRGGPVDRALMFLADFILVLPGAYLVLVLRGVLPLVLSPSATFGLLVTLFAMSAWPHVARGVRAIVAAERAREYAEAARASGAGAWRLFADLVPAAHGFLAVEIVLLIPVLLVAEATVSFLGLGFPETLASWGTMLQDAVNVAMLADAPWLLAPAGAIFLIVLMLQLVGGTHANQALFATSRSPWRTSNSTGNN